MYCRGPIPTPFLIDTGELAWHSMIRFMDHLMVERWTESWYIPAAEHLKSRLETSHLTSISSPTRVMLSVTLTSSPQHQKSDLISLSAASCLLTFESLKECPHSLSNTTLLDQLLDYKTAFAEVIKSDHLTLEESYVVSIQVCSSEKLFMYYAN